MTHLPAGVVIDNLLRTLDDESPGEDASAARAWLQDLRTPLVLAGVDTLVSIAQATAAGRTNEELERAFAQLTPAQIVEVMKANAVTLSRLTDQAVRQAGLWRLTKARLTTGAASLVMRGLVLVL